MYITTAKFEEHCFNISRGILDCVLCCFSGPPMIVITSNTKNMDWISLEWKKICQKGKRYSSLLWKAFQIAAIIFYFIGTLNIREVWN